MSRFEEARLGSARRACLSTSRRIAFFRARTIEQELAASFFLHETHRKVLRVLEQAEVLAHRYHVVVAYPPYMGAAAMNPRLKEFVEANWRDGKGDTYSAFMMRNMLLAIDGGQVAMITIPNWMFLKGLKRCETLYFEQLTFLVLCIAVAVFGDRSCAFVLQSLRNLEKPGIYKRLFKRPGEVQSNEELEANFFNVEGFPNYSQSNADFRKIPCAPIAYRISKAFVDVFQKSEPLGNIFRRVLGCLLRTMSDFFAFGMRFQIAI